MDERVVDTSWWHVLPSDAWPRHDPIWRAFGPEGHETLWDTILARSGVVLPLFAIATMPRADALRRALPPAEPVPEVFEVRDGVGAILLTLLTDTTEEPPAGRIAHVVPFLDAGPNLPFVLRRALLAPDRCAAILEATWPDGAPVAFYDLHWPAARALYEPGRPIEFCLRLLAQEVAVLDPGTPRPPWLGAGEGVWFAPRGAPDQAVVEGAVTRVWDPLPEPFLGCIVTRVDVAAGGRRTSVLLTDRVAGDRLPAEGERIAALGWVSGHLWALP